MEIFGFDIETIPCQIIPAECLPQFDPGSVAHGNTTDPAKRKTKELREREKFNNTITKKMSISPDLCQLCTFAGIRFDTETDEALETVAIQVTDDDLEAVADGWEAIQQMYLKRTPIVTFNGRGFDFPVMLHRAMLQDVVVDPAVYRNLTPRYGGPYHYDLMEILADYDKNRWRSMDFYLKLFGIGAKTDGMDGSKVYDTWMNGHFDQIKSYCIDDVLSTCRLFARVQPWIV